jgi:hypothetical protein
MAEGAPAQVDSLLGRSIGHFRIVEGLENADRAGRVVMSIERL